MYLHEDRETFKEIIEQVAADSGRAAVVVEKDYYANVSDLINAFCDDGFYKNDYQEITNYFAGDYVAYEDTIRQMRKLASILSNRIH